jgi:hypothetical protein
MVPMFHIFTVQNLIEYIYIYFFSLLHSHLLQFFYYFFLKFFFPSVKGSEEQKAIFKRVIPFFKALGIFKLLLCAQMVTAKKQEKESKKIKGREGDKGGRERERNDE